VAEPGDAMASAGARPTTSNIPAAARNRWPLRGEEDIFQRGDPALISKPLVGGCKRRT